MNKTEILNTILSIPGAVMARANKTNFIAIPTEDGIVKVAVTDALDKDTKTCKAFNLEAAVAEYKAYVAETARKAVEKANKPVKEKGVNAEAQARRDAMDKAIAELPAFTDKNATEITAMLVEVGFLPAEPKPLPMQTGQSALRLVANGILTVGEDEKGKRIYTKA